MSKIKIEEIQDELEKEGWQLVSSEYKNLESEMVFKCPEGHSVYSSWKKMRQRKECPICKENIYKNQNTTIIPKKKEITRFLALDQSTNITGWSIYDGNELIKYGVFSTSDSNDEIVRDYEVRMWLINMVNNWKPDFVGIEGIQYQQNFGVTTFETLARLQGIIMETLYELNLPYVICPTNTWRHHCGVKGRTRVDKKKSMQLLVKEWFDITITDDEADAIGIGKYISDVNFKKVEIINWE